MIKSRFARYYLKLCQLLELTKFCKNKGRQSAYKGTHKDLFLALVPELLLTSNEDRRKNTSLSYSNIAANGVMPGTKISPRLGMSSTPSWNETWTKAEDWIPVPPCQEDIFQRSLGDSFRAQYKVSNNAAMVDGNSGMAYGNNTFSDVQLQYVNSWLASLEQASIPPPDTIEFVNCYGDVTKMIRQPHKQKSHISLKRSSSSEFPMRNFTIKTTKSKGKGKAKAISTSKEDKMTRELLRNTREAATVLTNHQESIPELDLVINQALNGNTWYEKPKLATKQEWFKEIGYLFIPKEKELW